MEVFEEKGHFFNFRDINTKLRFVLKCELILFSRRGWLRIKVETNLGLQIYMYLSALGHAV